MLQCLAQFGVALLNLFEQTHVLDRNDRLIGKVFRRAICFSVKDELRPSDIDIAYRKSFSHQRDTKISSCAEAQRQFLTSRILVSTARKS